MIAILASWEVRRRKSEHKHFLLKVEKVFVIFLGLFLVKISADSREESTVISSTTQTPKNEISERIELRQYNYNLQKYAGQYLLVTKYYVLAHMPYKVCVDSTWKFDYSGPRGRVNNPFRNSTKRKYRREIVKGKTSEKYHITHVDEIDSITTKNSETEGMKIERNSGTGMERKEKLPPGSRFDITSAFSNKSTASHISDLWITMTTENTISSATEVMVSVTKAHNTGAASKDESMKEHTFATKKKASDLRTITPRRLNMTSVATGKSEEDHEKTSHENETPLTANEVSVTTKKKSSTVNEAPISAGKTSVSDNETVIIANKTFVTVKPNFLDTNENSENTRDIFLTANGTSAAENESSATVNVLYVTSNQTAANVNSKFISASEILLTAFDTPVDTNKTTSIDKESLVIVNETSMVPNKIAPKKSAFSAKEAFGNDGRTFWISDESPTNAQNPTAYKTLQADIETYGAIMKPSMGMHLAITAVNTSDSVARGIPVDTVNVAASAYKSRVETSPAVTRNTNYNGSVPVNITFIAAKTDSMAANTTILNVNEMSSEDVSTVKSTSASDNTPSADGNISNEATIGTSASYDSINQVSNLSVISGESIIDSDTSGSANTSFVFAKDTRRLANSIHATAMAFNSTSGSANGTIFTSNISHSSDASIAVLANNTKAHRLKESYITSEIASNMNSHVTTLPSKHTNEKTKDSSAIETDMSLIGKQISVIMPPVIANGKLVTMTTAANYNSTTTKLASQTANATSETTKGTPISLEGAAFIVKDKHATEKDTSEAGKYMLISQKYMIAKDPTVTVKNTSVTLKGLPDTSAASVPAGSESIRSDDESGTAQGTSLTRKDTLMSGQHSFVNVETNNAAEYITSETSKFTPLSTKSSKVTEKYPATITKDTSVDMKHSSTSAKDTSIANKSSVNEEDDTSTSMTARSTSFKAKYTFLPSKGVSMTAKPTPAKTVDTPVPSKGTSTTAKPTPDKVEDTFLPSKGLFMMTKPTSVNAEHMFFPSKGIFRTSKSTTFKAEDTSLSSKGESAASKSTSVPVTSTFVTVDTLIASLNTDKTTLDIAKGKFPNEKEMVVSEKQLNMASNDYSLTDNRISINTKDWIVESRDIPKFEKDESSFARPTSEVVKDVFAKDRPEITRYTSASLKDMTNAEKNASKSANDTSETSQNMSQTSKSKSVTKNDLIESTNKTSAHEKNKLVNAQYTYVTAIDKSGNAVNISAFHKYISLGKNKTFMTGDEPSIVKNVSHVRENDSEKTNVKVHSEAIIQNKTLSETQDGKQNTTSFDNNDTNSTNEYEYVEVEYDVTFPTMTERMNETKPVIHVTYSKKEHKKVSISESTVTDNDTTPIEYYGYDKMAINSTENMFTHDTQHTTSSKEIFTTKYVDSDITGQSSTISNEEAGKDEFISPIKNEYLSLKTTTSPYMSVNYSSEGQNNSTHNYEYEYVYESSTPFVTKEETKSESFGDENTSKVEDNSIIDSLHNEGTISSTMQEKARSSTTVDGNELFFTTDNSGEIISSLGRDSVILSETEDKDQFTFTTAQRSKVTSVGYETSTQFVIENPEKAAFITNPNGEIMSSPLQETAMMSDAKEQSTQHSSEIVSSLQYESEVTSSLERPDKYAFTTDRSVGIISPLSHESIMLSMTEKTEESSFVKMEKADPDVMGVFNSVKLHVTKLKTPITQTKPTFRTQMDVQAQDGNKRFQKFEKTFYTMPTCQTMTDGVLLLGGFSKCDEKRLVERDASTSGVIGRYTVHTRCNDVPYEGVKSHEHVASGPGWFLLHFPIEQVPYYLTTYRVEYRKKGDKQWKTTRFARSITFRRMMPRVMPGYPCPPWKTYLVFCVMISDHVRVGNKIYEDYEAQIVTQGLAPEDAHWNNSVLEYMPKRYAFTFRVYNCDPTLAESCPPESSYRQNPPVDQLHTTPPTDDELGNYTGDNTEETTSPPTYYFTFNGTTIPWPTINATTTPTTVKPGLPFFLDSRFWYLLLIVDLLIASLIFFVVFMWAKSRAFTRELEMIQILNHPCLPVQIILKAPPESIRLGCSQTLLEPSPCPSNIITVSRSSSSCRSVSRCSTATSTSRLRSSASSWHTQSDPGVSRHSRRASRLRTTHSC